MGHHLLQKKWSLSKIGRQLNRVKSWAWKWVQRYRSLGIEGLYDHPRSGRPTHLGNDQVDTFINRIQNGPIDKDEGTSFFAFQIKGILDSEFRASYSIAGVYKLLNRLGFSKIKARPKHVKNDVTVMKTWKEEFLPAELANIKNTHPEKILELWFQDEMRFGERNKTISQWKLRGTSYTQIQQTGFRNAYIFGSVNPESGQHVGLITNEISTEMMNLHLNHVSKAIQADHHVILIMDQAGWHAKSTKLIVPKNITIVNLPPYSPELNPIERLWKWLKEKFLYGMVIKKSDDLIDIGENLWNKIHESKVKSICRTSFTNFL